MKPGRNDPCPCGSGRKFKHCCGSAAAAVESPEDFTWRRLRQLLDEDNVRVHRFTLDTYGPEALLDAWHEFMSPAPQDLEFDPESRHIAVFMSWFRSFWSPDPNDPESHVVLDPALVDVQPLRAYLARRGARLDPLLREYHESCLVAPLSFHEVAGVEAARGLLLEDLVTGERRQVTERALTEHCEPGDVLFGQVVGAGGHFLLECASSFAFPPIARIEIAKACKRLVGRRKRATFPLREYDLEMLEIYHAMAERVLNPRLPELQNTDGDPFSLRKVVFDVDSARQALEALRHLDPGSDEELAREMRFDAEGKPLEGRLSWVEPTKSPRAGMSDAVLAFITISATRMVAEVNSERREARLRGIVEKALGKAARYRATEIQSVERALEERLSRPRENSAAQPDEEAIIDSPEVRALLDGHMSRYYEHWVSERIPALGNRTPLQAVKTREGREAVAALVAQIERDGRKMRPPLDPAIVRRLRERLGLD